MKSVYGISVFVFLWFVTGSLTLAQDEAKEKNKTIQKEVKVIINDDSGDPQFMVETTTTEDGEKKMVKKTYNSLEEMKADSTIEVFGAPDEDGNFTMKLGDKSSGVRVYTNEDGEKIDIKIDEITEEMEWIEEDNEDGHKVIISSGGKIMIFKGDEDDSGNSFYYNIEEGDSNKIVKRYEVKVIKDGEDVDHKIHEYKDVFILTDGEGNMTMHEGIPEEVLVWVDEEGNKSMSRTFNRKIGKTAISKASIEPVGVDDAEFSSFNLAAMPELVLKSMNYYPNPNEGEFTLAFSGSKKPVIVRIIDLKGNLMLEENINDFNGTFNEVINVKPFDKGTYLLQIFQQDKVLNRKLILE